MANEEMGTCVVVVGGHRFDKWLAMQLKREEQGTTCSGSLVMSWQGSEETEAGEVAIEDGADGQILLDGQLAATIRFDQRTSTGSPNQYLLQFTFRGMCSVIVDGMPKHPSGQENDKTPRDILKKLIEGTGIGIIDKSGSSKQIKRFIIDHGETMERAGRRATREYGLNYYETVDGNLMLHKADYSEGTGQPMVLGKNFFEWQVQRDMSVRASQAEVFGNAVPTDDNYGKTAEVIKSAFNDTGVGFGKLMRFLVDGDHDQKSLKERGRYEQVRRSQQGLNVTLHLSTWSDNAGELWKIGYNHHVRIPVDQVDSELKVTTLVFQMTPTTRSTTMTLVSDANSQRHVIPTVDSMTPKITETVPPPPKEPEKPAEPPPTPPPAGP